MDDAQAAPVPALPWWRVALRLALLAAILLSLQYGGNWAMAAVYRRFMPLYDAYGSWALVAAVLLYVVAMALPFVPGIEISLALIVLFGAAGAVLVYVATWFALCLSYLCGRMLPPRRLAQLFGWLVLKRARALVERLAPLPPNDRVALLLAGTPRRLLPFLLRNRYLALAVAFNLPGNSLMGGGGGLALAAGLSGLFRFSGFALMVALAIAPIPLLVVLRAWYLAAMAAG